MPSELGLLTKLVTLQLGKFHFIHRHVLKATKILQLFPVVFYLCFQPRTNFKDSYHPSLAHWQHCGIYVLRLMSLLGLYQVSLANFRTWKSYLLVRIHMICIYCYWSHVLFWPFASSCAVTFQHRMSSLVPYRLSLENWRHLNFWRLIVINLRVQVRIEILHDMLQHRRLCPPFAISCCLSLHYLQSLLKSFSSRSTDSPIWTWEYVELENF